MAQAVAVAHRSDAAQHAAGGIVTAEHGFAGTLADGGHSGDHDPSDSTACELCHVAGKLPVIASAALERVATAVAPPAPNPAPIRVLAAAAHYRSALPRAPPRGTIETR